MGVTALAPDLEAKLDELAGVTGRTREDLLAEAVRRYVDDELAVVARIQRGIADLEAGRYRPWEQIEAELIADGSLPPDWADHAEDA